MKRVICLYRVSTVGQVDHDDIPMQKLACREYAASHPDWQIVDEISDMYTAVLIQFNADKRLYSEQCRHSDCRTMHLLMQ